MGTDVDGDLPVGAPLPPGWTAPPAPARRVLVGRAVRLEPLLPAHAPALHEAFTADHAGRIWTYLAYGPFERTEDYEEWVAEVTRGGDPLFFAFVPGASGRPEGVASYLRIRPEAGTIEIGHICLAPALQRTRAATEGLFLMMRWAFAAGYRRLEWKCDALNAASRRAAERLGFTLEGVFRQATHYKGRNRDTAWYAIIDRDWPALEGAFETWLDDANFDAEGRQRRSLSALTREMTERAG